jgi:hypothetical protein
MTWFKESGENIIGLYRGYVVGGRRRRRKKEKKIK